MRPALAGLQEAARPERCLHCHGPALSWQAGSLALLGAGYPAGARRRQQKACRAPQLLHRDWHALAALQLSGQLGRGWGGCHLELAAEAGAALAHGPCAQTPSPLTITYSIQSHGHGAACLSKGLQHAGTAGPVPYDAAWMLCKRGLGSSSTCYLPNGFCR